MLGYKSVGIEKDNYEAFRAVAGFSSNTPAEIFDLVEQIDSLRHNNSWICHIAFVFPAKNRVARYTAKLGMENGDILYTLDRPVGAMEEMLDWDLGMGVDHPDFMDVHPPVEAPDPVNFDLGMTLADNIDNLGMGQADAPASISIDKEEDEGGLQGIQEEAIYSTITFNESFLYANESLLNEVD